MLRRTEFFLEIIKQIVVYDKFKNLRKIIKTIHGSIVFDTGLYTGKITSCYYYYYYY
jgi:hypothetical protein